MRPRFHHVVLAWNAATDSTLLAESPMSAPDSTTPASLTDFVWGIADQLRGVYKPNQYGTVVLPLTILRHVEKLMPPLGDHAGAG